MFIAAALNMHGVIHTYMGVASWSLVAEVVAGIKAFRIPAMGILNMQTIYLGS